MQHINYSFVNKQKSVATSTSQAGKGAVIPKPQAKNSDHRWNMFFHHQSKASNPPIDAYRFFDDLDQIWSYDGFFLGGNMGG